MLMGNWYGMLAPAGVPRDTLAALEAAMVETMKSPQIAARLASGGVRGATGAQGFATVMPALAAGIHALASHQQLALLPRRGCPALRPGMTGLGRANWKCFRYCARTPR
jgi:hypothetical protein